MRVSIRMSVPVLWCVAVCVSGVLSGRVLSGSPVCPVCPTNPHRFSLPLTLQRTHKETTTNMVHNVNYHIVHIHTNTLALCYTLSASFCLLPAPSSIPPSSSCVVCPPPPPPCPALLPPATCHPLSATHTTTHTYTTHSLQAYSHQHI